MAETTSASNLAASLGIYLVGVALAVTGALGLAEAIELSSALSIPLFAVGIGFVVFVHERLGGPF